MRSRITGIVVALGLAAFGAVSTAPDAWAQAQTPPAGAQVETPAAAVEPPEPATPSEGPRVRRGGDLSFDTRIHIPAGEVHQGDVVCFGCDAVIEGEVTGDIVVVSGTLMLSGRGRHDVVCVLSNVTLKSGAEISHDFVNVLGHVEDEGAIVGGQRVNVNPFFSVPGFREGTFAGMRRFLLGWWLLKLVITFVVIIVLAAFIPERIRTLSAEVPVSYGVALLAGLAGYIALWVVAVLLVISLIGIPVAGLTYLLFLVFKVIGLAGIFHRAGSGIGRSFNREMSLLGAVLLGFVIFGAVLIVPQLLGTVGLMIFVGLRAIYWLLIELPAVGLVLLTRAGGRPRLPSPLAPQPPGVPVASPPGPAMPGPPAPGSPAG